MAREDALALLDTSIQRIADNLDSYRKHPSDFTRNRKLPFNRLIKVILKMQGNSINAELFKIFKNINERPTSSAFEQQKDKLSPRIFEDLLTDFNSTLRFPKKMTISDSYRVVAIDGSDFALPFDKKSKYVMSSSIGRPKNDGTEQKPVSLLHGNFSYDLLNNVYLDCIMEPKATCSERDCAVRIMERQNIKNCINIMDRGYDGFNMIEHCNRIPDMFYVIRTKSGYGGIKEIYTLPDEECDRDFVFHITLSYSVYNEHKHEQGWHFVEAPKTHYKEERTKPTEKGYSKWDFAPVCDVKCRVVKFKISEEGEGDKWEVLLTNLNRFEFPIAKMKKLYHMRWGIETSFRKLKYALSGMNFHSKKDEFIEMELWSHFIMYNVVSRYIAACKVPAQKDNKYPYAIDFKMACQIMNRYFTLTGVPPPHKVATELLSYLVPIREGRKDKRKAVRNKSPVLFVYRVA